MTAVCSMALIIAENAPSVVACGTINRFFAGAFTMPGQVLR